MRRLRRPLSVPIVTATGIRSPSLTLMMVLLLTAMMVKMVVVRGVTVTVLTLLLMMLLVVRAAVDVLAPASPVPPSPPRTACARAHGRKGTRAGFRNEGDEEAHDSPAREQQ